MRHPDVVLVTGGAGYLGSVLVRGLLATGHRVRVLDRLFFGRASLAALAGDPRFELVEADIRSVPESIMDGVAAVMDLAALSNDPAGDLDPEATLEINHRGRNRIAAMALAAGVGRYILASSCSVYGFRDDEADEDTPPQPLTTYARANILAEQGCLPLARPGFCVTALRMATLFGPSHRMRFDLAVNGIVLALHQDGKARVLRDGTQWRPFLHVADAARAFQAVLAADPATASGRVFNVGSNDQNVQLLPLARSIAGATGIPFDMDWYGDPDARSYRVRFDRIAAALRYRTQSSIASGAAAIHTALRCRELSPTPDCFTVKWYKSLIDRGLKLR